MNLNEIVMKHAKNGEERELLSRIYDLVSMAQDKGVVMYSNFLTPSEQAIIKTVTEFSKQVNILFDGGYEEAERAVAVLKPDDFHSTLNPPITALKVEYRGERLSHRDILGALMSLGIKREKVGDILADAQPPTIICDRKIGEYIKSELKKIAHTSVKAVDGDCFALSKKPVERITATVASMRIDSVVAEGFKISRTDAAQAIKRGLVQINWLVCESTSKQVNEGDKISLKGKGKIELAKISGQSRKGRTFVEIDKYL